MTESTASSSTERSVAILRRLVARDFRNLVDLDLDVPAEGLALVGDNGQGKTSILEAIYYLHLFRSVRGARDQELVRFGAPAFHVSAISDGTRWSRIGAGFERETGRRRILLDGVPSDRVVDALGALPAVAFSPADVALVTGGPGSRRRWLDVTLATASPRYLAALREYRSALAQRNAALRARSRASPAHVWDRALADHGAVLAAARASFLDWARPRARATAQALGEHGPVELRYRAGDHASGSDESLRAAILGTLAAHRDRDVERGLTHAGPHRDDVDLRLEGMSLRRFGSAGQQRTAAITLRLLECAWHREQGGHEPLLLLDDPVAELDRGRAERVLGVLASSPRAGQVVLAVPRDDEIPAALAVLARVRVRAGVVEPWHA